MVLSGVQWLVVLKKFLDPGQPHAGMTIFFLTSPQPPAGMTKPGIFSFSLFFAHDLPPCRNINPGAGPLARAV